MLRLRRLKQLCEDAKRVVGYVRLELRRVTWSGDTHSV